MLYCWCYLYKPLKDCGIFFIESVCIFLRHLGNCIDSTRLMHVLQLVFPSISPQCYFILCGELETLVSSVPQLQSSWLFTSVVCLFGFFFQTAQSLCPAKIWKSLPFPCWTCVFFLSGKDRWLLPMFSFWHLYFVQRERWKGEGGGEWLLEDEQPGESHACHPADGCPPWRTMAGEPSPPSPQGFRALFARQSEKGRQEEGEGSPAREQQRGADGEACGGRSQSERVKGCLNQATKAWAGTNIGIQVPARQAELRDGRCSGAGGPEGGRSSSFG